ncbi:GntR family transcriptional regulator [Arthrobacter cavernae]|uniref:GntR family transcriptional regulator n=1 Tax=Arthrobacter cavernae TaxID=2817681 RepID=A0A939HGX5_9MICC|nr:GntR family transcriptional regulator [Arthrobacter cavernae]MBO1268240.1 GntR family transcriptional regulator [Arthrobacter cavernae]
MAPTAKDTRPLAVRVYEQISSDIIAGTIEAGTALVQEQVAAQYGVSRTPVRDALTQLTLEGLATLVPGRGYIVNTLSPQDVKDVYEVRYTLESLAARQACGLHSPQQLVRLRGMVDEFETVDPADAEELFRMGAAFHAALIDPCPNTYLRNTLAAMWDHPIARRITMTYRQGPEHQSKVARDHRRILEALKTDDPDTIAEVLRYCHNPNDTLD